ncbi:MAG: sensor histidine kinase [Candidatus Sericytochromatia bacterium]
MEARADVSARGPMALNLLLTGLTAAGTVLLPEPARWICLLAGLALLLGINLRHQMQQAKMLNGLQASLEAIRQNRSPEDASLTDAEPLRAQLEALVDYVQQRVAPDENHAMVPVDLEKNELESIIHCMNDGLIIYDMDLNVILLNPALAEMMIPSNPAATGRLIQNPDDKLLFERCVDLKQLKRVHTAMTEEPNKARSDVLELKNPVQFLKRYASPLYNRFHEQIGHVIIYHNITQEVQSEKVRSEFITNASHELRTPVTSMKLLLEALESGAKDDPKFRDEFLRNLLREADRLHILVNDLLDLSRLETAHERLAWTEIDVRKVVHDSLLTVLPLAQKKGIELKENIEEDLDRIWADQLRLGQVLVNLVNNAVKFTSSEGEVRIIARRLGESIEFKIQDTGIGIPQEDLPYVFDRFYRVEQNRQRRNNSGGSGLGLTITKQVVEMHGGKIQVTSSPKGTTFTFTIPQKAPVVAATIS